MRVDSLPPDDPDRTDGPQLLGRYRLLRLLARGGMSEVYLGYDVEQGRPVAVKMLNEELARDLTQLHRFKREATLAVRLDDPHIVRGFAHGVDPETDRPFLVLEYINGPSAQARLDRVGRFEVSDVVHIGIAVARALHHLHRNNYIHRDVKPDNILLSPYGEAKLTDFGLVKWTAKGVDQLTLTSDGFGTSYYMPYEQCLNAHLVDPRSDIFALGATLYHLVTGRVPFAGEDHRDIMRMKRAGHFTPPSLLNPQVPPVLEAVLNRMLAVSPMERYQTASDAYVALKRTQLATGLPTFVDLGEPNPGEPVPVRSNGAATRPDLRLRASGLRSSRLGNWWYLRRRDRGGRLRVYKGTTQQIVRALRRGRLAGTIEASRQQESRFRPLAEFPEFHAFFGDPPPSQPVPVVAPKPRPHVAAKPSRCWYRRMLVSLGFALFVLGIASVWSILAPA